MLDNRDSTPACAPGARPQCSRPKHSLDQADRDLRESFLRLPADRQQAAIRDLALIAGGPVLATGDDVIDDLADLDLDDSSYLILDPQGGSDDDED